MSRYTEDIRLCEATNKNDDPYTYNEAGSRKKNTPFQFL